MIRQLISIVMPVYNGASYLRAAIDSLRVQSYTHWELIAVDDGSRDESSQILSDYAQQDERIKVITNRENIGLPRSLNVGIKQCKGEYVARMDADDVSEPTRFECQVEFLESHPEFGLLGCSGWFIDEAGNKTSEINLPPDGSTITSSVLMGGSPFTHGSWMLRARCLEKVGLYNEFLFSGEDKDLLLRMSEQFVVGNLPDKLYQYRMHAEAFTNRTISQRRLYRKLVLDAYDRRKQNDKDIFGVQVGSLFEQHEVPAGTRRALLRFIEANKSIGRFRFISFVPQLITDSLMSEQKMYMLHLLIFLLKVQLTILFTKGSRRLSQFKK